MVNSSKKKKVYQLIPTFSFGDASSNFTLQLRERFNNLKVKNYILTENIDDKSNGIAKKINKDYSGLSNNDILIYHLTIGSDIYEVYKRHKGKKVIIYHNITPSMFFRNYDRRLEYITREGRKQLKELASITDLSFGVSEFNRQELVELGFKNTHVFPIILNFQDYDKKENMELSEELKNNELIKILFVGRVVPNKKIEDLIKVFYIYNKNINKKSQLNIVGNNTAIPIYTNALIKLTQDLGLSQNVSFKGTVAFSDLISYYKSSDIFLSMSEHEGFMVPLIESMNFELPIVAYGTTAIPYTLDNAGLILENKDYATAAEAINILVSNQQYRDHIKKLEKDRIQFFKGPYLDKIVDQNINMILKTS